MNETPSSPEHLLRPRSIAIVGASSRVGSFGRGLQTTIEAGGYGGAVFLVNPRYDNLDGVACYPSIAALPGKVDCVAFAVADTALEAALRDAVQAGARAGVVFGRAFGTAASGQPLTEALGRLVRDAGLQLCGANCMGYLNHLDGLQMTGMPFAKGARDGRIALISHSGSTWSGLVGNPRLKFSIAVSAGQELGTDVASYLTYFCSLPTTRVICCVLETIRDPQRFLRAVESARARGIAVIALKLGRSEAGAEFAKTHSGALSGRADVYDAVFKRAGVISVRSLDELVDTAELFANERTPAHGGLAMGTDSGGERQLISDLASDIGLRFAPLQPQTIARIEPMLDVGMPAANPLDYWGDQGAGVIAPCLQALADDPAVGTLVMANNLVDGRQFTRDCSAAAQAAFKATTKPVVVLGNVGSTVSSSEAALLRAMGIPVLMGTETGLRALKHYCDHHAAAAESPASTSGIDSPARHAGPSADWIARLTAQRADLLTATDSFELLEAYDLPTAAWTMVDGLADALTFARRVGYPIVAKIGAAEVAHKSDIGGVILNINSAEALASAVHKLQDIGSRQVFLQQQLRGTELILGMSQDAQFGPVFTLGLGGVFVEVMKDFALLLPGADEAAIVEALRGLRAWPLLAGARGGTPADLDALVRVVARFIALGTELAPWVDEIEINPLLIDGAHLAAVDALVVVKHQEAVA